MKHFIIALPLLFLMQGSALAEDPLILGLRGALKQFQGVPEESARPAQAAAVELLGRYMKKYENSQLLQYSKAMGNSWVEIQGLKLRSMYARALTEADRSNGLRQSIVVIFECEMHRKRKMGASAWSEWVNGSPGFFPGSITVNQNDSGTWVASASHLEYFVEIGQRGKIQAAAAGAALLPPGMSRPSTSTPSPQPQRFSAPSPVRPYPPTVRSEEQIKPLAEILPKIPTQQESTPQEKPLVLSPLLPYMAGALVILSVIPIAKKKRRRRSHPARSAIITPPPLPPPPLPEAPRGNLMDLMERRANLMTPAELAFYSVLSPIVGSDFMISSKVRLADLFQIRDGRGQKAAFNKIVGKHVDFVIVHPSTSRILCGIELDDRSHQRPDRIERDRFVNELFASNHLPLLRIPVARFYDPERLKSLLREAGVALEETPAQ